MSEVFKQSFGAIAACPIEVSTPQGNLALKPVTWEQISAGIERLVQENLSCLPEVSDQVER